MIRRTKVVYLGSETLFVKNQRRERKSKYSSKHKHAQDKAKTLSVGQ